MSLVSLPVQPTLSRQIVPVPAPKWALLKATASVEMRAYATMSVKAYFKPTQTQYQQFRERLYVTVYTICHVLTLSRVSKLSTHHGGITTAPGVITHSAPHIVHTDLHSPLIGNVTTNQSQLTSCARSCVVSKIMDKKQTTNKYKNIFTHKFVTTFPTFLHQHSCTQIINVPSQPTPASSECWQLCVKIGLLEHSSS